MKIPNTPQFQIRISKQVFLDLPRVYTKVAFLVILMHSNNGWGKCWASRRTMAEEAGMSPSTFDKEKTRLIKMKVIREVGSHKVPGGFTAEMQVNGSYKSPRGSDRPATQGGREARTKLRTETNKKIKKYSSIQERQPSKLPSSNSQQEIALVEKLEKLI